MSIIGCQSSDDQKMKASSEDKNVYRRSGDKNEETYEGV